jgi:hypothetical protein
VPVALHGAVWISAASCLETGAACRAAVRDFSGGDNWRCWGAKGIMIHRNKHEIPARRQHLGFLDGVTVGPPRA